jgi:hypothetical protein
MKRFSNLTIQLLIVILFSANAHAIDHSGDVWGVWSPDNNPHDIIGEVRVPPESTLVIQAGCYIDFQGHYKFLVDTSATLIAAGTESDSIVFTAADTITGWHGIRFYSASSNSEISYCRIEYANATVSGKYQKGGGIYLNYSDPTISNNTIINNRAGEGGGIFCHYSSPSVTGNTITDNSASGQINSPGGGIYCTDNSSPIISGNIISRNSASGGPHGPGGGIFCIGNSTPIVIEGNTITHNSASAGGGIWCRGNSDRIINDNIISYNSVSTEGGGIYCVDVNNLLIENNTISSNSAGEGGGIFNHNSSPSIINNTIIDNSASGQVNSPGGGIYCGFNSNPLINGNIIRGNSASGSPSGPGGGIHCSHNSNPMINGNTISDNSASDRGGGICCLDDSSPSINNNSIGGNTAGDGGGLYFSNSGSLLSGNTIINNLASDGGGVLCVNSNLELRNNIISNNSASLGINSVGGGINCRISSLTMVNNTFYGNFADDYGGGISCDATSNVTVSNSILWANSSSNGPQIRSSGGSVIVSYSDIEGGWSGDGNIDEDPLFADPLNNDLNLTWATFPDPDTKSPCIDTGNPDTEYDDPDGTRNDMGALYFDQPMTGSICVSVSVTGDPPSPAEGVIVSVTDDNNDPVGYPLYTDSNGETVFDSVSRGYYSVMIVTPLGYDVIPSETQTDLLVVGGECIPVEFALIPVIIGNDSRTIGYWRHQFNVYTSGRGRAQETASDLESFLDQVYIHFDVLDVYIDLENFDFGSARDVLTVRGGNFMLDRAKQQLFALLLNFASERIGNETVVSDDGRVAAEAVTCAADLINDGNPENDELAKTICDLINNGIRVDAGIIPESSIRYKPGVDDPLSGVYLLGANAPNPFNAVTRISFILAEAGEIRLDIYNLMGQRIETLIWGHEKAGHHSVTWDASGVASGVYFYRLQAGDFVQTKRMTLLK